MNTEDLKVLIRECIEELLCEQYQATIRDPSTGQEVDVDVEYEFSGGHMGGRVGMARFAEPDEPAQVEITSITTVDGQNIDPDLLDRHTLENLEQEILDSHQSDDF